MQERSLETRARVLQCAARLFAKGGYEATGVAEICAESRVSKGAFYHHFPSKQSLFIELLKDWLQGIDAGLGQALSTSKSVPRALVAMAGQIKGVLSAADGSVQLFLEFWQQARRDPKVWKEFIAPYRRYQEYFARIIQKGIDEGSIRALDPQAAGRTLVSLAIGMLVQGVVDPEATSWDAATVDSVKLLISGMEKK